MKPAHIFVFLVALLCLHSCAEKPEKPKSETQFTRLSAAETGVDFNNTLQETEALNYFVP